MAYVKQAYILKENIKLLRGRLRKWNKDVFGWLDLKIEYVAKEFNRLYELLINNELMRDDTIEEKRKESIEDFGETYTFRRTYSDKNQDKRG